MSSASGVPSYPSFPPRPAPPDISTIDPRLDLEAEILALKRQKNAVLLAHYYQEEAIQDLADFVGDSLDLSRRAQQSDARIIAFAGVRFMAETAKILNPTRKVVLPDYEAGCSLEDSCPPDAFRAWREAHPGAVSLTYINCSAAVKALSDIIVTSSNAEKIVRSIPAGPGDPLRPGPPSRRVPVEDAGPADDALAGHLHRARAVLRARDPEAEGEAPRREARRAPRCPEAILKYADHVGSTRSILSYVTTAPVPGRS